MDTSLENETFNIYRREIEKLLQQEPKYKTLGVPELDKIAHAFKFTLEQDKVRVQMLYELIGDKE